jgi:hypothetical protein
MIKFPCHCGHSFQFEDEMAGRQVQCPDCGRLNDIPSFDDLRSMSEDGTYKLDAAPALHEPGMFEKLHHVYTKDKVDANGQEIDLRVTPEEVAAAGEPPIPLAPQGTARPLITAPRYDPETGELIRELPILNDQAPINPASIPMAQAALHYATGQGSRAHHLARPLLELFMPVNVVVMVFVLVAQVVSGTIPLALLLLLIGPGPMVAYIMLLPFPLLLLCGAGVLAHYSNVIEDIGPDDRDELPRFLRNLSIREDIWRPFANFAAASFLCFGPLFILWHFVEYWTWRGLLASLPLQLAASAAFPVVLLTTTTSGSILNLRPDRLLGTVRVIGAFYLWLVGALLLTELFYAAGLATTALNAFAVILGASSKSWIFFGPLAYTILCGAIYLMHYFCWQLGLVYRREHHRFPWVLQRHIPRAAAPTAHSRVPLPEDMR